jgi:hypothetical protein
MDEMKVVIMGGPKDGEELDLPPGTQTWRFPTVVWPIVQSISLDTPMPVKVAEYAVRTKKHVDGRKYRVLVEPTLDAWVTKNFREGN